MKKRWIGCLLATGMLLSCGLTACGGSSGNGDVEGKTTIRVATYPGGLGLDWLRDAAARFEDKYKNESFEEGKTGVAVKVEESQAGDMLASRSLDKDVYLTESVDYYYMQGQGKFADISDVVTDILSAYDEDASIEDKLDGAMKNFLTAKDGNYYAIPFYEGFYGFIYDADMFELNGWFFDESGNFTKKNKSTGIDGKAGTYDDGLPKTYEQFGQLIDEIRGDGVTPFVYSSETMVYFVNALANYWADYEGKEKMQRNWSLDGEIDIVTSFDGDKPVTEKVALNVTKEDSGNLLDLQKQPGKYYALKFLKEIVMGNGGNYVSATDFKAAQYQLIQSCLDGEMQPEPVAMIIDGSWFENEAQEAGTFEQAAQDDFRDDIIGKDYKKTRKLAFMPIPMVDESEETLNSGSKTEDGKHKQTLYSANDSFCFINAGTTGAKLEVSKEFLKFVHTDVELSKFTQRTSITRPYTYTITEEEKEAMSYFGQTLMEMKTASDIVYPYSNHPFYVANSSSFLLGVWGWRSRLDGTSAINPFNYFRANPKTTVRAYFEGLHAAH